MKRRYNKQKKNDRTPFINIYITQLLEHILFKKMNSLISQEQAEWKNVITFVMNNFHSSFLQLGTFGRHGLFGNLCEVL